MKKIITSFLVLFSFVSFGQEKIEFHTILKGNQEYLLKVSLPTDYSADKNYPVLYYLDAWLLSNIVTGSYRVLRISNYLDDVVLVGISIEGDELEFNTRRTMDFTPSKAKPLYLKGEKLEITRTSGAKGNEAEVNAETTGGADEFIKFLSNDVLPSIENKYPNLNKRKGLLGHSFGGLFGTYLLQKQPDLFDDYLLISGSLAWNDSELLNKINFKELENSTKTHQLFLTFGTDEVEQTTETTKELNNILKDLNKNNFNYLFKPYEKANHHSILSRAIYDGLLFLYEK